MANNWVNFTVTDEVPPWQITGPSPQLRGPTMANNWSIYCICEVSPQLLILPYFSPMRCYFKSPRTFTKTNTYSTNQSLVSDSNIRVGSASFPSLNGLHKVRQRRGTFRPSLGTSKLWRGCPGRGLDPRFTSGILNIYLWAALPATLLTDLGRGTIVHHQLFSGCPRTLQPRYIKLPLANGLQLS